MEIHGGRAALVKGVVWTQARQEHRGAHHLDLYAQPWKWQLKKGQSGWL